nr:putative ribonuclease H-like domain-containing protein [Tanacetum cinerariifolium]
MTFIVGLENLLSLKGKIIRCDNKTEFKNSNLNQFCRVKGIKREFSVLRTPQQNGIAERKNKTLIKATRTLLADSLLPIPFWTEAVNTPCYVQNRVLVTKPHNKTPYCHAPPDFTSQVLLRVPRENNMYNVNLKNIVPFGDLTCLFAKATLDESNLWHRRLGHVNFKTINKLVKGNLVRGLPTKVFTNGNSCVACKKGKQHRASCKSKIVSSVDQPLFRLHMDLLDLLLSKAAQGNPQQDLKDKGVIDSGCSWHMTRKMSYLSDFVELNGGYVAIGGNPKGGKIMGK